MNAECLRIADQLRRAFTGNAWHGAPISELLQDVTTEQASVKPLASAHSIWELVLHIEVYVHIAHEATQGIPMPKLFGTGEDWFEPTDAWEADRMRLFEAAERLAVSIEAFEDERLMATVPGRGYDFYHLFHGIVQHSLYHAGQIAMLKRLEQESATG